FFLRAQNGHTDGRNKVFFDTACLYPAVGTPTSTPWMTPTPSPTPTLLPGMIDDTDSNIVYVHAWTQNTPPEAINQTTHSGRGVKGTPVVAKYQFTGTQITVWYVADQNHGKAKVVIDGVKVGVIDQYAPTTAYNLSRTFDNLIPGAHLIKIRN